MKFTESELDQIDKFIEDYEANLSDLDKEALASYNVEDSTFKEGQ